MLFDQAVVERTGVDPAEIGDIVVGTVLAPGSQRANECRMAAFYAGFPGTLVKHFSLLWHFWMFRYYILLRLLNFCNDVILQKLSQFGQLTGSAPQVCKLLQMLLLPSKQDSTI